MDASVAAKWWLPETGTCHAQALLDAGPEVELKAPALLLSEVANIAWKRARRGDITSANAGAILQALMRLPLEICPTSLLIERALDIALESGRSVYDAQYIALAELENAPLVTADGALWQATRGTAFACLVTRLGDPLEDDE